MTEQQSENEIDVKQATSGKAAPWQTYARLAVGKASLLALLKYECLTTVCAGRGGALGIVLRKFFYSSLLGSLGKGSVIGRHVTLRGSQNIHIGRNVLIDEGCLIDARGEHARIRIADGVIISRNTTIRARNATLDIGEKCDIGANCLLATDSRLELGREVLVAAYVYLVGGGLHRFDASEPIIMRQAMDKGSGIIVGDGCWIGTRSSILDGVKIGDGAVIGAHSLVTHPVPPMSVAFGNPAKVVRAR